MFGILIAYVDSENSCFIFVLNDTVLIFDNVHFPNFEISASL